MVGTDMGGQPATHPLFDKKWSWHETSKLIKDLTSFSVFHFDPEPQSPHKNNQQELESRSIVSIMYGVVKYSISFVFKSILYIKLL